jgi:uncharacterized Zn-finger protein
MKIEDHKNSTCPDCKEVFDIHKNRACKIKTSMIPGGWFYHAMNQFENFNQVICPFCGNSYKSKEARLFGIFKSPHTVGKKQQG